MHHTFQKLFTFLLFALLGCVDGSPPPTIPLPNTVPQPTLTPPTDSVPFAITLPATTTTPSMDKWFGGNEEEVVVVDYAGISLQIPTTIADTVHAQQIERHTIDVNQIPASIQFNLFLNDTPTGIIELIPISEFTDLYPTSIENLEIMTNIIQNRPTEITLPDLRRVIPGPFTRDLPPTHLRYLDFQNGTGVAFLTQWGVGMFVRQESMTYDFYGLDEGENYYIRFMLNTGHPSLPADMEDIDTINQMADLFTADSQAYFVAISEQLNGEDEGSFMPALSLLDKTITSLKIEAP